VAALEQRVADHAALLAAAEARAAAAQPLADAAWKKAASKLEGAQGSLDDIMDDYEEGTRQSAR
jgi:hypothetical protein